MQKYHQILRNTARVLQLPIPIRNNLGDQINRPSRNSKLNVNANRTVIPVFSNPAMIRRKTLAPVSGSGRWVCAILDFLEQKIMYIDSLGSQNGNFDFETLKNKSIEIRVAINYLRDDKLIAIPNEMEFIQTKGSLLNFN